MILRTFVLRRLAATAALSALVAPTICYAQEATYTLNIPAQDLGTALKALASATGQQVAFRESTVRGKRSNALDGRYTLEEALTAMTSGAGVAITRTPRGIIVVSPGKTATNALDETPEDIVVTGSNIRNANPTSPVTTIGRREIEESGYTQTGDLMRSIPQNFSGGQNPGVIAASTTNIENSNIANASSLNLRGVGTGATLTLINGHRLSPDAFFQGADISIIPLDAIERVEIVPDGASAIYGSDAVAGVVNFILRRNFNGVQTTADLGVATQGGGFTQTYSGLAGISRSTWHLLANYQYLDQDGITADQRERTAEAGNTSLVRPQNQHSIFATAGVDLSNAMSFSVEGNFSHRSSRYQTEESGVEYYYRDSTPSYAVAASLEYKLRNGWNIRASATAAGSKNNLLLSTDPHDNFEKDWYKNSDRSVELVADGSLLKLPSGDVKVAIGAGRRHDTFSASYTPSPTRNVTYVFGEMLVVAC